MILNFRVKNFKSIKDLVEIDFVASKQQRDNQFSLIELAGEKVLPIVSIYGANGSGKSNVIKAMTAMAQVIRGEMKERVMPYISSFAYDESTLNEPTFFEIMFMEVGAETVFRYGFECTKDKIHQEWLYTSTMDDTSNETEVFYRNVTGNVIEVHDSATDMNEIYKHILETVQLVNENELISSVMYKRVSEFTSEKINENNVMLYEFMIGLVKIGSVVKFTRLETDDIDYVMLKNAERELNSDAVLNYAISLVKEIDPSINKLEYETEIDEDLNENNKLYTVRTNAQGDDKRLPATMESSGTKKMLYLAAHLSKMLSAGGMFVYDELDLKLHPLLFRKIVRMFSNKEINQKGAQLIFSSHNLICLDSTDLRRDSIYFTEKVNNVTELYALADIKINGELVRADLDFGKNYLAGRFGAVPFQEDV